MQKYLEGYLDKLKEFNNTDKYKSELNILEMFLQPNYGEVILDYGCGIGTAVEYFRAKGYLVYGYDKVNYYETPPQWFRSVITTPLDKVYLMHSIAHIKDVGIDLPYIRAMLKAGGEIVIITPNADWLDVQETENYKPDLTVKQHYSVDVLTYILKECGFKIVYSGQFGATSFGYNERIIIKAIK